MGWGDLSITTVVQLESSSSKCVNTMLIPSLNKSHIPYCKVNIQIARCVTNGHFASKPQCCFASTPKITLDTLGSWTSMNLSVAMDLILVIPVFMVGGGWDIWIRFYQMLHWFHLASQIVPEFLSNKCTYKQPSILENVKFSFWSLLNFLRRGMASKRDSLHWHVRYESLWDDLYKFNRYGLDVPQMFLD